VNEARTPLNRRRFLLGASAAAGTAILAACGGSSDSATTAPVAPAAGGATTAATASSAGATATMGAGAIAATKAPAATTAMTAMTAAPGATTAPAAMTTGTVAPAAATTTTSAPAAPAAPAASGAMSGKVKSQIDTAGIKKGGTLIEAGFSDVRTFNPVIVGDTTSGLLCGLIYDNLVDVDPDTLQPIPNLATKWDISPDGKTYTFTLKPGVKWHDGQPFTADDVKFSFDSYLNPDTGTQRAGALTQRIASVDVKDPLTVVFTLKAIIAPFLTTNINGNQIVAKHIFGTVPPKELRTNVASTTTPVGTGPFKIKSYKPGDNVTLSGNPDYHKGATALDTYIYKVVKDSNVLLQQLKTGETDFGGITADTFDEAKKQPNLNALNWDSFSFTYFGYNLDRPLFQDVKLRQALFYAVDRSAIVKQLYNGLSTVAVGTMPPISWAAAPDKIMIKYEYDPKKAAQMLDDAGWKLGSDGIRAKGGQKLSFSMWTNSGNKVRENYLLVLQEGWKAIGVEMKPQTEEFSVYLDRINKNFDFDMFLVGFSWGVDPDQTTMWDSMQHGGGFNSYHYSNPMVDMLLDQGLHVLDQDKRKQIYLDMQNRIIADAPALVSDFPQGLAAINKRVKNRIPNGVAGSDRNNAHQWYVTDGK